jgi:putative flippase GtrA
MVSLLQKLLASRIFRYFISAGLATWVDVVIYFLAFNYLYEKSDIVFTEGIVVASTTASLVMSYTAGLITNFTLTKMLVFKESDLQTHKQLFRYILVALLVLALNWLLMRFLIRSMDWYPTIARATSAILVGVLSFSIHKVFSFRSSK